MNVLYITASGNVGGAELFSLRLANELRKFGVQTSFMTLREAGSVSTYFENDGHRARMFSWKNLFRFGGLSKLRAIQEEYDLIVCLGLPSIAFANASLSNKVIWAIHSTASSHSTNGVLSKAVYLSGRSWSKTADRVIYCSNKGRLDYEYAGFDEQKSVVIPNGIEIHPPQDGKNLRKSLGFTDEIVFCKVARFHPVKNHAMLFRSYQIAVSKDPRVALVCAGSDMCEDNEALKPLLAHLSPKAKENLRLLGERRDIPELLSACDSLVISSESEAFPMVILESFEQERPVVSTRVGDAPYLVEGAGFVANIEERSLANAMLKLSDLNKTERKKLGLVGRARLEETYTMEICAKTYFRVFQEALASKG